MSRMAAAIDFGTSKIAVVTGKLDERGTLMVTGAGQQYYAGFREDEWLDVEGLEEAILSARKAAEKQSGHRIKDMFVAVPGDYIKVAFNRAEVEIKGKNGLITRDDIEKLIEETGDFDAPDGYIPLHRTPVAYIIENQTRYKPPIGERAKYLCGYVSHVLALESFVEDVGNTLNSLGIGILGMVAGPVGTGYLVRTDGETRRTAIVIDAGHYSTDVIVAEGDGLVFHENIPVGGGTITKDIALLLNITLDEAERLKKQLALGIHQGEVIADRRGASQDSIIDAQGIAETRVWDLSARIAAMLENIGINFDGQTGIYLTGGGLGLLRGAKDILSSSVGKIVKTYSHQSPMLGGPAYTTAAGTLYYALNVLQSSSVKDIIGWIKDLF
jgi:cell division protein FtsA